MMPDDGYDGFTITVCKNVTICALHCLNVKTQFEMPVCRSRKQNYLSSETKLFIVGNKLIRCRKHNCLVSETSLSGEGNIIIWCQKQAYLVQETCLSMFRFSINPLNYTDGRFFHLPLELSRMVGFSIYLLNYAGWSGFPFTP